MIVAGTSTTCTLDGTTVPTLTAKLTLLTRGALLVRTSLRIVVRCSVVRLTPPEGAVPTVEPDFVLSWVVVCDLVLPDGDWAWDLVESLPIVSLPMFSLVWACDLESLPMCS